VCVRGRSALPFARARTPAGRRYLTARGRNTNPVIVKIVEPDAGGSSSSIFFRFPSSPADASAAAAIGFGSVAVRGQRDFIDGHTATDPTRPMSSRSCVRGTNQAGVCVRVRVTGVLPWVFDEHAVSSDGVLGFSRIRNFEFRFALRTNRCHNRDPHF